MATIESTRPGPKTRSLAERFWEKVEKRGPDDCWEWQAGKLKGYGQIGKGGWHGKMLLAHRVAWELEHGPIPPGMCVLHDCDNPPCVNEAHLFLGTKADNNADMLAKGRNAQPRGEAHARAKLTAAKVRDLRREYAAGEISQYALARKHGVGRTTIRNAISGKTWRSVA